MAMRGRRIGREGLASALARLGLDGHLDTPARQLSQGQNRRVALARLFLSSDVPLWILDEPFTALDVRGVEALRECIRAHVGAGGIVVLTTHQDVPFDGVSTQTLNLGAGEESPSC
jgi:heme exporter protein A